MGQPESLLAASARQAFGTLGKTFLQRLLGHLCLEAESHSLYHILEALVGHALNPEAEEMTDILGKRVREIASRSHAAIERFMNVPNADLSIGPEARTNFNKVRDNSRNEHEEVLEFSTVWKAKRRVAKLPVVASPAGNGRGRAGGRGGRCKGRGNGG